MERLGESKGNEVSIFLEQILDLGRPATMIKHKSEWESEKI